MFDKLQRVGSKRPGHNLAFAWRGKRAMSRAEERVGHSFGRGASTSSLGYSHAPKMPPSENRASKPFAKRESKTTRRFCPLVHDRRLLVFTSFWEASNYSRPLTPQGRCLDDQHT